VDLPTLAGLLFTALGVENSDEILARMFPDGEVPADNPAMQAPEAPPVEAVPAGEAGMAEAMMVNAVRELRTALVKLEEGE
jgi:hypothetical protein